MEAPAELIARARLICGEQHVLTNPTVLATYRSDGIRRNGPLPLVAVLPGNASEVAGVVSACVEASIPYVARGAGTSHSGGALPIAGGALLVLSRLRRILAHSARELTVEAGAPITALPRPVAGTWFETDEQLGTVGGHIAECRGAGSIAALELVRPGGALVRLDAREPGYDVIGAFAGSQGQAGIAVTITLRATTKP